MTGEIKTCIKQGLSYAAKNKYLNHENNLIDFLTDCLKNEFGPLYGQGSNIDNCRLFGYNRSENARLSNEALEVSYKGLLRKESGFFLNNYARGTDIVISEKSLYKPNAIIKNPKQDILKKTCGIEVKLLLKDKSADGRVVNEVEYFENGGNKCFYNSNLTTLYEGQILSDVCRAKTFLKYLEVETFTCVGLVEGCYEDDHFERMLGDLILLLDGRKIYYKYGDLEYTNHEYLKGVSSDYVLEVLPSQQNNKSGRFFKPYIITIKQGRCSTI